MQLLTDINNLLESSHDEAFDIHEHLELVRILSYHLSKHAHSRNLSEYDTEVVAILNENNL